MSWTLVQAAVVWACLGLLPSMRAPAQPRRLPAPLQRPFHYDARPAEGGEGAERDPMLSGDAGLRRV
jgi:hypothetical protein